MPTEPTKSQSFHEAVLYRPKMYTMGGTFAETIAFLNGFYSGAAKHNLNFAATKEMASWYDFQQWLAVRWNVSSSLVFSKLLESQSNNSEAALSLLLASFEEFMATNREP